MADSRAASLPAATVASHHPSAKVLRNISYDLPLLKQRLQVLYETEREAQLLEISTRARNQPGAGFWTRFWFRMTGDGTLWGFYEEFTEWILQRRKRVLDIYLPPSLASASFDADPSFHATVRSLMRSENPQLPGLPPLPMGSWGLTALPPSPTPAGAAAAASAAAAARSGCYPVVIHCHGGSWQRGSQSNEWRGSPSVCRAVAAAGGIGVAVAYRLSDPPILQIVLRGIILYVFVFPVVAITAYIAGGFSASAIPNPALALAASVLLMLIIGAVLSFASGRVSHPTHANDLADAVAWTHEFLGDVFITEGALSAFESARSSESQEQHQQQQQQQQQAPPQLKQRACSRFVLSGHSAGGHLAMIVGVDPAYLDGAVSRVNAIRAAEREELATATADAAAIAQAGRGAVARGGGMMAPNMGTEARDDSRRGPTAAAAVALRTLHACAAAHADVGAPLPPPLPLAVSAPAPATPSTPAAPACVHALAAASAPDIKSAPAAEPSSEATVASAGPSNATLPAASLISPLLEGPGDAIRGAMVGVVGLSGVYSLHKPASRNFCRWRNILFRLVLSAGIFGYTTESHKRASPTNVLQRRTHALAAAVDGLKQEEQWAVAAVAAAAAAGSLQCLSDPAVFLSGSASGDRGIKAKSLGLATSKDRAPNLATVDSKFKGEPKTAGLNVNDGPGASESGLPLPDRKIRILPSLATPHATPRAGSIAYAAYAAAYAVTPRSTRAGEGLRGGAWTHFGGRGEGAQVRPAEQHRLPSGRHRRPQHSRDMGLASSHPGALATPSLPLAGAMPSPPFEEAFLPGSPLLALPHDADAAAAAAAENAAAATGSADTLPEAGPGVVVLRVPELTLTDLAAACACDDDADGEGNHFAHHHDDEEAAEEKGGDLYPSSQPNFVEGSSCPLGSVAPRGGPLALQVPDDDDVSPAVHAVAQDRRHSTEAAPEQSKVSTGMPASFPAAISNCSRLDVDGDMSISAGDSLNDEGSMSTVIARPKVPSEKGGLLSRFNLFTGTSSKPDQTQPEPEAAQVAAAAQASLADAEATKPATAGAISAQVRADPAESPAVSAGLSPAPGKSCKDCSFLSKRSPLSVSARDFTPLGPLLRIPPVLLLNAENDLQLDMDAGKMARVLRRSGIPVDRIVFPGLQHDTIVSVFERNQARPVFLRFLQGVFATGAASAAADL